MTTPTFIIADPVRDRGRLLELNLEYMIWTCAEVEKVFPIKVTGVLGMSVPDYVNSVIDKVCGAPPPDGVFYLIEYQGSLAGMGGLRTVRDGVSELKRVYVRPAFRGKRLGEAIVHRLLRDAADFGFGQIVLDSGPFMTSAHRLYEAVGFKNCPPYPEAEVPGVFHSGWRFMTRALHVGSAAEAPHRPA